MMRLHSETYRRVQNVVYTMAYYAKPSRTNVLWTTRRKLKTGFAIVIA